MKKAKVYLVFCFKIGINGTISDVYLELKGDGTSPYDAKIILYIENEELQEFLAEYIYEGSAQIIFGAELVNIFVTHLNMNMSFDLYLDGEKVNPL